MKKVININFQGRVIPIEEAAYEMLQRYVESLRLFFANEEGRDEIINDIEGRIAELFGESLKKGSTCITDTDINTIISSMGRPEDFDDDEAKVHSQLGGNAGKKQSSYTYEQRANEPKRLYRDENHKVLAGVCAGIANYFGVDPSIVRILFIISIFLGIGFIAYLIFWVAVPSSASTVIGSQRRRLFRDSDNKIIAGVCSGLAQYFTLNIWIPRALFLIPFFTLAFRFNHWGWWDFPQILSLSFSPGSIFIYIILWLILPEAKSAADKLEMKGEKVDLNTIKTTIQGDLEGFKDRAQQFGSEMREKAQEFGETLGKKGRQMSSDVEPVLRRSRRGLGDVIVLIAKIFAYFILGCVLFSVVVSLFTFGVLSTSLLPIKHFLLRDGWQSIFAWGTLLLFIWVPVVGIVTWIIRRLAKKRGNSLLIRSTFIALWIAGLFCAIGLISSLVRDFHYRNKPVEQAVSLTDPRVKKLEIKIAPFNRYYTQNWFRLEPFASIDEDTVYVRNIRLRIVKAAKDSFQVTMVKLTNGRTKEEAEQFASNISYSVRQSDTTLLLDKGISLTADQKFRNQQIVITVAVPVGKRILINENVGWGNDVNIHFNHNNDWDWRDDMDDQDFNWDHNVEYVMTQKGLERVDKGKDDDTQNSDDNSDENSDAIEQYRKSREQMEREKEQKIKELQNIDKELLKNPDTTGYHYRPSVPSAADTTKPKKAKEIVQNDTNADVPNGINDLMMIKFAL